MRGGAEIGHVGVKWTAKNYLQGSLKAVIINLNPLTRVPQESVTYLSVTKFVRVNITPTDCFVLLHVMSACKNTGNRRVRNATGRTSRVSFAYDFAPISYDAIRNSDNHRWTTRFGDLFTDQIHGLSLSNSGRHGRRFKTRWPDSQYSNQREDRPSDGRIDLLEMVFSAWTT